MKHQQYENWNLMDDLHARHIILHLQSDSIVWLSFLL